VLSIRSKLATSIYLTPAVTKTQQKRLSEVFPNLSAFASNREKHAKDTTGVFVFFWRLNNICPL
jgi:hypothetical protein